MKLSRLLSSILLALTFVACGDDDEETPEQRAITLAVDATSVTLAAGETRTVTVSIRRPRDVGNASLTVTGAPSDVSATIDPASAADSATVTIATTTRTTTANFNLTVLAVASDLSAVANIAVTVGAPAPVTINGRLVGGNGAPLTPTEVSIWGAGATQATVATINADGSFTATGIQPPYDVRFAHSDVGRGIFLGLTTPSPVILAGVSTSGGVGNGLVRGSLGTTAIANTQTLLGAACALASGSTTSSSDTYSLDLYGNIAAGETCRIDAARVTTDPESENPVSWLATVSQNFTSSTDGPMTVDLTLGTGPIAQHNVTLDVDPRLGTGAFRATLGWLPNDRIAIQNIPLNPSAPFAVPNDVALFTVLAQGGDSEISSWITSSPVTSTTTSVRITPAPLVVFDIINQNNVPADAVEVTPFASAPASYFYIFESAGESWIIGSNAGFTASQLAARGFRFDADATYFLQSFAFFSQPTLDAFAGTSGLLSLYADNLVARVSLAALIQTAPSAIED